MEMVGVIKKRKNVRCIILAITLQIYEKTENKRIDGRAHVTFVSFSFFFFPTSFEPRYKQQHKEDVSARLTSRHEL